MPTDRSADTFAGYGRSAAVVATILSGQTTVAQVDLGRNYAYLVVVCADASHIAASSKLQLQVAEDTGNTPVDLWTSDGAALWQSGVLPATAFRFVIPSAFGVQIVKPILTNAASGGNVALTFYGFDPTVQGK